MLDIIRWLFVAVIRWKSFFCYQFFFTLVFSFYFPIDALVTHTLNLISFFLIFKFHFGDWRLALGFFFFFFPLNFHHLASQKKWEILKISFFIYSVNSRKNAIQSVLIQIFEPSSNPLMAHCYSFTQASFFWLNHKWRSNTFMAIFCQLMMFWDLIRMLQYLYIFSSLVPSLYYHVHMSHEEHTINPYN